MIIRGSEGKISKFLLKEHSKSADRPLFQSGNLDEFLVDHKNIGQVSLPFSASGEMPFIDVSSLS